MGGDGLIGSSLGGVDTVQCGQTHLREHMSPTHNEDQLHYQDSTQSTGPTTY